jgi:hypothetical protein
MSKRIGYGLVVILALVILSTRPVAANKNFVADWSFSGSSLEEFRTLGDAEWHAENGENVGAPHSVAGG